MSAFTTYRKSAGIAGTLLLAVSVVACKPATSSNLPTHNLAGGPAAQLESVSLALDGNCLVVGSGASEWLAIWPSGYRLDGDLLMNGLDRVAATGDVLTVTGGSFSSYEDVQAMLVTPVPPTCRARPYWVVAVGGVIRDGP